MIILGTLVVITSMASIYNILGNFGGGNGLSSSESNIDSVLKLKSNIETQCTRLSEYDTILSSTVEFQLNDAELQHQDSTLILNPEGEQEVTRDIECEHSIDFRVENGNELSTGRWEAEISGSGSTITVEVK